MKMKIRSTEFLVGVAIVTSAAVLQIREHTLPQDAPSSATPALACGAAHDGLVPAGCEPTRGERETDRAQKQARGAQRIWV
ncbi:hypothetical protein PQQ51_02975 [Paraburkholderia xenovorans]|uniref:hypothetical protein n=1 Tax=Paraburkholderia xenovorans TaxID=36873 RepID=UPI0038B6ED5A